MKKQIILLTYLLLLVLAPVVPAKARSVARDPGDPTPIPVTNGNDDGLGSLRAAIRDADPAATIDFTFTGVVLLTSGELLIDKDVTISGPGSTILTVSPDPNSSEPFRILEVNAGAHINLSGVTLAGGHPTDAPGGAILNNGTLVLDEVRITNNGPGSPGFPILTIVDAGGCDNSDGAEMVMTNCSVDGNSCNGYGGGILSSGTLTITSSTISGNTAGYGGGILSTGTLTITNSTITGNVTIPTGPHGLQGGYGGGLSVSGSVNLVSDTISANQTIWSGGGIIAGSSVNMANCILAANTAGAHPEDSDIYGTVQSGGYNLVGVSADGDGFGSTDLTGDMVTPLDPKLGPLQDNGGPTLTMALLPGSPALDHGISASLITDQTGALRTVDQPNIANPSGGDGTDIGAVEAALTTSPFANISTRVSVGTSDNALIGGFIITGTQAKKVIVRAIGPSLPVPGALADPILELHDSGGASLATNDNWQDSPDRQAIIDSTVSPSDDKESAIIMSLDPAAYTAVVRGVNDTTGVGLVEVYDLDATVDSKLANISTRGFVQTDDNVMIGGLIILGVNPTTTLLRAIGPSLLVPGALQDPTLELHNSDGATIAANDNWRSDQETEIVATTLPPTNDAESAILATLVPGAYTAVVRGTNGTTGVALVEAYQLDN